MLFLGKQTTSATLIVVLTMMVVALSALVVNLSALPPYILGSIEQLPPTSFLYFGGELTWVSSGRMISHMIIACSYLLIGWACAWYGWARRLKMIRFITITMGIQYVIGASVHLALAGVISTGGWWHIAAAATAAVAAVMSVSTAVLFVALQGDMRRLGRAHDDHIEAAKTDTTV